MRQATNKSRILRKNKGFTLAEVLITITIIGIVAALTIPNLINNVNKQQYTSAFKKTYSSFSQATSSFIIEENGGVLADKYSSELAFVNGLAKYLSFVKICPASSDAGVCFHHGMTTYHTLHGGDGWNNSTLNTRAIGKDGALYRFIVSTTCSEGSYLKNGIDISCANVLVDINGFKGPNTTGRDIFLFVITEEGLKTGGEKGTNWTNFNTYCSPSSSDSVNGVACAAKLMMEGDMNY